MYPILRPILNRGGAGFSMSRPETVEHFNRILRQHQQLINSYDAALRDLADRDIAATIEPVMNRLRTELAKLRETVLANGGAAPSGIDLDPATVHLGSTDYDILQALSEQERAYRDALQAEIDRPNHQMRSYAIIENNHKGSLARLDVLHPIVTRLPRPDARRTSPAPIDPETGAPADIPQSEHHSGPDEQPFAGASNRDRGEPR